MATVSSPIIVIGAGQVGRSLTKAMLQHGMACRLQSYRRGMGARLVRCQLILICVRDDQVKDVVERLRHTRLDPDVCVAHVSGSLGPEILSPLKPQCRGIAQLHPFCSIRAVRTQRDFKGIHFTAAGDRTALARLRKLVTRIGGRLVSGHDIDRNKYHLAAALLANGTVALAREASRLLIQAGFREALARSMLNGLVQSVVFNLKELGPSDALTGPIRRGDLATIDRHLSELERGDGTTRELYRALALVQVRMVRELAELESATISRLRRRLSK